MIFILENGIEMNFDYNNRVGGLDWIFSKIYINQSDYFYFSLTLFGGSVTMQKKKRKPI